jgi:hypothetical protein
MPLYRYLPPAFVTRVLLGANMNITTDQAIPLQRPCRYVALRTNPAVGRASISLTTATGGFYAGAGKTVGLTAATALSPLTGAQTGSGSLQGIALSANYILDQDEIYFACTNAQGSAATADLIIQIAPLWELG